MTDMFFPDNGVPFTNEPSPSPVPAPSPTRPPADQPPTETPTPTPPPAVEKPEPATKPILDLDTWEAEGVNELPFTFRHDGRVWTLTDPLEVDWQELLVALRSPIVFFGTVLPKDDRRAFLNTRMSVRKMRKLMNDYQDHFGLDTAGNGRALSL